MKVLYAASEREGAQIQLLRFLQATSSKNYTIKIAAYKTCNPGLSIDWNLEALKDIFTPDQLMFNNDKLNTYYDQIKYFNPDIIISDLELYTSYIAVLLGKPIWQVSPNLLHHATPHKEKMAVGLFKQYPHLFMQSAVLERTKNAIFNADRKLVYSHFGDAQAFDIVDGFEWVRPYHTVGKESVPCHHNAVAATFRNNKRFINYIKKYKDSVLFSTFVEEKYPGVILKSIYDWCEYECNLKNCDIFISQGHNDFLADAFYNGKQSIIMPNFNEQECITNALYSKNFKLGTVVYNSDLIEEVQPSLHVEYDSNIKYLHQYLEEI